MQAMTAESEAVPLPGVRPPRDTQSFLAEMDRVLLLLRNSNMRISLFALTLHGLAGERLPRQAEDALTPVAFTGRMHDGRLAILYVGPRPASGRDGEVWDDLRGRLKTGLAAAGGGRIVDVAVAHAPAASIGRMQDLIRLLVPSNS
ncbi:MAG: hypothetical protein WD270_12110 [Acetobacterales bacterium]